MARDQSHKEAVKVVVIETRYVETDEENFKAVVQSLTGKDSDVLSIGERGFEGGAPGVAPGGLTAEELDRLMVEELLHVVTPQ